MLTWLKKLLTLPNTSFYKEIHAILGFMPNKIDVYHQAFCHRSVNDEIYGNNERLEFLGDAIFNTIITEHLFEKLPNKDEGELTDIRSKIVSRKSLNQLAKKLKIDRLVRTNLGNQIPSSIYGNTLEALIAAIYLDKGSKVCKEFISKKILQTHFNLNQLEQEISSYKKYFIQWAQKNNKIYSFRLLNEGGEAHNKNFKIGLFLREKKISTASAGSKKKAEEAASKKACHSLAI